MGQLKLRKGEMVNGRKQSHGRGEMDDSERQDMKPVNWTAQDTMESILFLLGGKAPHVVILNRRTS